MLDTRREVLRLWQSVDLPARQSLLKILISLIIAGSLAFLFVDEALSHEGQWSLFILVLAAGLWMTEAIPAFSTAILIIALQIMLLGNPGEAPQDWEKFIRPWGSPIMWLFLGGFILGSGAQTTGLDRLLSRHILRWCGDTPKAVLFGAMLITFIFSMFMSNTASTVMMLAVMAPVVASLPPGEPFKKAFYLGIPFAANVGGMGTLIGSPPNAIAAGTLPSDQSIDFAQWMVAGFPPAALLFVLLWVYLNYSYKTSLIQLDVSTLESDTKTGDHLPMWKRLVVVPVFFLTVLLWMTSSLHDIPTPVISFLPITLFAATGVLRVKEFRSLPWDVLILLAGGLSLGVGIRDTGLADWLVNSFMPDGLSPVLLAFFLSYTATILSNFMSNTAATNILVPIGIALAVSGAPQLLIPIALGSSSAMCLPISTPPNAIAFTQGDLPAKEFIRGGIFMGILGPLAAVLWVSWIY